MSHNLYNNSILTNKIVISASKLTGNIQNTLTTILKNDLEGKCHEEGYIKPNSIKIINYSAGLIDTNSKITFSVSFECGLLYLTKGLELTCIAESLLNSGIHASIKGYPIIVDISRDYYNSNMDLFNSIQVGDKFICKIINQQFELNDKTINILGELISKV